MREIEIKLKVDDLSDIKNKIKEKGGEFSDPIEQHDSIYTEGKIENLYAPKEGKIVIRIRKQNEKFELNLKRQKSNEMDNIECETDIGDPDTMNQILNLLGWQAVTEVKKTREKGKLGDCNICLDQVERLGSFIELEKITDDHSNPENIREELFKIAETLGLSRNKEITKGYDTQIYELNLQK